MYGLVCDVRILFEQTLAVAKPINDWIVVAVFNSNPKSTVVIN